MGARERALTSIERREALRAGVDVRPGEMVTVEIVSRSHGAHAGFVVSPGAAHYTVHEADVKALEAMVETANEATMRVVKDRLAVDEESFRASKGRGVRPSLEAAFRVITGRDLRPFVSVRVIESKGKA